MIINIPEELTIYLQMLAHEVEARKDLLAYMLKLEIPKEKYDIVFNEYIEKYMEYRLAKEEMFNLYIKPLNIAENTIWKLNFNTCECEININE
jgi:hypothetical protein